jgi:lipopolysaccharide biosynthesis glycosyltransferase
MTSNVALCTVSSKNYLSGTLVMINSFLKNNKWFEGEIVVIHNDLEENDRNLFRIFKSVVFRSVSNDLTVRIDKLVDETPSFESRKRRFFSLELFFLEHYEKVLFLDSDILVVDTLEDCFTWSDEIACAPDLTFYLNLLRDKNSFGLTSQENSKDIAIKSFNAGFMLANKPARSEKRLQEILEFLKPVNWSRLTTSHTDQYLLNRVFEDNVRVINPEYCLISGSSDRVNLAERRVRSIHYVGHTKPWLTNQFLSFLPSNPLVINWNKIWHEEYLSLLEKLNVSLMVKSMKK